MKHIFRLTTLLLIAALATSCAGAPPPQPQPIPESVPEPAPVKPEPAPLAQPAPIQNPELEANLALAQERRVYIAKHGLEAYAPESFGKAEELFRMAQAEAEKDRPAAAAHVAESLTLYDATIKEGFGKKLDEKKLLADKARARADAEKAKVADKAGYAAAETTYADAKKALASSLYPEALVAFEKAATGFDAAAKTAAERRVAAEAAMERANQAIQSTEDRLNAIDTEISQEDGAAQ